MEGENGESAKTRAIAVGVPEVKCIRGRVVRSKTSKKKGNTRRVAKVERTIARQADVKTSPRIRGESDSHSRPVTCDRAGCQRRRFHVKRRRRDPTANKRAAARGRLCAFKTRQTCHLSCLSRSLMTRTAFGRLLIPNRHLALTRFIILFFDLDPLPRLASRRLFRSILSSCFYRGNVRATYLRRFVAFSSFFF